MRVLGFLLGFIALKDLLWSMVSYSALAFPARFYWAYVDLPRLPFSGDWGWLPVAMQTLATFSSLALIAGVASRASALALFGCYVYAFLADRLAYTNNVYVFLVFIAAYAVGVGHDPRATKAAGRAVQLFVSSIYLTCGLTKLSALWLSGRVLREALYEYQHVYEQFIDIDEPWLFRAFALATVCIELLLAVGLWNRKTRPWAMAAGVAFHLGIEVLMPVRMFSYLMIGSYVLFLDDETARRLQQAIETHAPWLRALAGLALGWLINRLFSRFMDNYHYTPLADLPLLLSVPLLLLILCLRGERSRSRIKRALAWPLLRWTIPMLLVLQAALCLKPLLGRPSDFAFRIFTDLVTLQVNVSVSRGGEWTQIEPWGAAHRWSSQQARYTWGTWDDERPLLAAYARWLAPRIRGAEAVRVEARARINGGPEIIERWEASGTASGQAQE